MPVSTPDVLTFEQLTTDATSHETASVATIAGRPLILYAMGGKASGEVTIPLITGLGVTWTYVIKTAYIGALARRIWVFTAVADGSTGTVVVDWQGQTITEAIVGIVQGAADWEDDPWMQPREFHHSTSFVTTAQLTMAGFKDAVNNGLLVCGILGTNDPPEDIEPGDGFTSLSEVGGAVGGQFGGIIEWKVGEDLLADFSWANTAHYLLVGIEIRAAGVTGGRVWDFHLGANGDGTDRGSGDPYITRSYAPRADADLWLSVYAAQASGTPPTPTVTGLDVTWTLIDEVDFASLATPLRTHWLFHARTTDPAPTPGTLAIEFATTVGSCTSDLYETLRSDGSVQTKAAASDNQAGALTATFDTATDDASAIIAFLARTTSTGVAAAEAGYAIAPGAGAGNIAMWLEGMSRHSNEDSPTFTPPASASMAIVAVEVAEEEVVVPPGGGGSTLQARRRTPLSRRDRTRGRRSYLAT